MRSSVLIVVQIATVNAFAELHERIDPVEADHAYQAKDVAGSAPFGDGGAKSKLHVRDSFTCRR